MTLPRFFALTRHWKRHPPVRFLLAAFIGFQSEETPAAIPSTPDPPEYED